MQFQLEELTECLLTNVHLRKEFCGKEKVQAIDLTFEIEGPNDILDRLDPALRNALYFNRAAEANQVTLPEILQVIPDLRVPELNGQKFKYGGTDKYQGYAFEFDYGLGGDSSVEFPNASAGKHEIETKDGGTAKHRFQVSYSGERLTDEAMLLLVHHEGKKSFIKLLAGPALALVKAGKAKAPASANDGQEDLLDGASGGGDGEGDEGGEERSAEDIFAQESQAAAG